MRQRFVVFFGLVHQRLIAGGDAPGNPAGPCARHWCISCLGTRTTRDGLAAITAARSCARAHGRAIDGRDRVKIEIAERERYPRNAGDVAVHRSQQTFAEHAFGVGHLLDVAGAKGRVGAGERIMPLTSGLRCSWSNAPSSPAIISLPVTGFSLSGSLRATVAMRSAMFRTTIGSLILSVSPHSLLEHVRMDHVASIVTHV